MLFRRSNALIVGLGLIESADSSEVSRGPPMYLGVSRSTMVLWLGFVGSRVLCGYPRLRIIRCVRK